MMLISSDIVVPLLGLFVGFVMSLTGAGGGILSVPLLVFGAGLSVSQAAPVGLLSVAVSAGLGAALAFNEKLLRYKAAALIALAGLCLSPIGLYLAQRIPNAPLLILFAVVLFWVSARMMHQILRPQSVNASHIKFVPCKLDVVKGRLIWTIPCARSLAMTGVLAGFLSGLLGVGGGFIIVPALKKYTDLAMSSIVATSMGVLALISTGGVITSYYQNNLDFDVAYPYTTGSVLGLLLGRVVARRFQPHHIQMIFSVFTLCVSCSLLIKGLNELSLI